MCGIFGFVGDREAPQVVVEGLKHLEYRGYDSAGVAVVSGGRISVAKCEGRIENLKRLLGQSPLYGKIAIGHTRWATHGKPCDSNSHPFVGYQGRYAIVHNGIIENFYQIKEELMECGVVFSSQTDSEVVCHLLEKNDVGKGTLYAIQKTVAQLKGGFALGIICIDEPDTIYAVKKDNPLIVGTTDSEGYVCSDINSLRFFLDEAVVLDNGCIAAVKRGKVEVYSFGGERVEPKYTKLVRGEANELEGYECYMDKEISEIPEAMRRAIENYRNNNCFASIDEKFLKSVDHINIVGCGTALHAGLYGEMLIRKLLPEMSVRSEMASEFRYGDVYVDDKTLTVLISQSGETADTLCSERMVMEMGGKTLAICNVPTSSISHEATFALDISAGPETAVASTKAYNCQALTFALFVLDLARLRGKIAESEYALLQSEIDKLPSFASETVSLRKIIDDIARQNFRKKSVFYLGRGIDYCVAMEGSLKLKEISYIHCEAYAAGELKHGTLALIEKDVLVIAIVTREEMIDKMCASLEEVRTRGASILTITSFADNESLKTASDCVIAIPHVHEMLSPMISVIPTQLISYYISRAKGCDIDKPRNLAKSVTVE